MCPKFTFFFSFVCYTKHIISLKLILAVWYKSFWRSITLDWTAVVCSLLLLSFWLKSCSLCHCSLLSQFLPVLSVVWIWLYRYSSFNNNTLLASPAISPFSPLQSCRACFLVTRFKHKKCVKRRRTPGVWANFNVIPALPPVSPSLCYSGHCDKEWAVCFPVVLSTRDSVWVTAPSRRLVLVSSGKKKSELD